MKKAISLLIAGVILLGLSDCRSLTARREFNKVYYDLMYPGANILGDTILEISGDEWVTFYTSTSDWVEEAVDYYEGLTDKGWALTEITEDEDSTGSKFTTLNLFYSYYQVAVVLSRQGRKTMIKTSLKILQPG